MEEELAAPPHSGADEGRSVRLLIADGDPLARSVLVSRARERVGSIRALEAEDGAEAIQLGLQQHPEIALLDVDLPRLGGIEAATTLRELQPRIRLAFRAEPPFRNREHASGLGLPLFSKLELSATLAWLQAQVRRQRETQSESEAPRKLNLRCTACGYGIVRSVPPERCPMCQASNLWTHLPPRLWTESVECQDDRAVRSRDHVAQRL